MNTDKKTGFTIVELIVTIIILAIMAVGLTNILMEGFRVWWVNKDLIDLRGDARTALNRISLEFRQAYTGTLTSSTDVSFTADIDSDGDLDTVRYYLDTGSLLRQVNGSPSPGNNICGNITGLTFSFSSPVLTTDITLSLQGNTIKAKNSIEGRNI